MAENDNTPAEAAQTGGEDAGETVETNGAMATTTEEAAGETTTATDAAPPQSGDDGNSVNAAAPPDTAEAAAPETPAPTEEISYHAVEKDGHVTAIWEMQGNKHLRTIDPRSRQGQEILRLYTSEHPDEHAGATDTATA
ncbi:MAG: hypothetical protein WCD76_07325 [Pyrinomonadaceae bacterium]